MIATLQPVRHEASLIFFIVSAWLSKSPWEKFNRTTFIPASIICSNICDESDAGPIVQTILVLFAGKGIYSSEDMIFSLKQLK